MIENLAGSYKQFSGEDYCKIQLQNSSVETGHAINYLTVNMR